MIITSVPDQGERRDHHIIVTEPVPKSTGAVRSEHAETFDKSRGSHYT